jgi:hypothetical protein
MHTVSSYAKLKPPHWVVHTSECFTATSSVQVHKGFLKFNAHTSTATQCTASTVCLAGELQVTERGEEGGGWLANSNFHIRLTDRMCCATNMLINLDVFPLMFTVPSRQTPSAFHISMPVHFGTFPALSFVNTVPTSSTKSYKMCLRTSLCLSNIRRIFIDSVSLRFIRISETTPILLKVGQEQQ